MLGLGMSAPEIVTQLSAHLLQLAAAFEHDAIPARITYALRPSSFEHPDIPSLIIFGGSDQDRDITAACYAAALIAAGLLTSDEVMAVDEPALDSLEADEDLEFEVNQHARRNYERALHAGLLIVRNVGTARRTPPSSQPDTYGYAPHRLDDITNERHNQVRPTVICSGLPVGNPSGVDLSANDPREETIVRSPFGLVVEVSGPNMGLTTALDDRVEAGWIVPSDEAGIDPDAHLVSRGVHSLQVHLGGRVWWRVYKPSLGTAIDAGRLSRR